jgi:hypothetical protein
MRNCSNSGPASNAVSCLGNSDVAEKIMRLSVIVPCAIICSLTMLTIQEVSSFTEVFIGRPELCAMVKIVLGLLVELTGTASLPSSASEVDFRADSMDSKQSFGELSPIRSRTSVRKNFAKRMHVDNGTAPHLKIM